MTCRTCSGSRHHHFGSSYSRSDLLISSVRRRNCPGNRPTAQPFPNGRRGSRQSSGGNRSPKHSWFSQTAVGTTSPLSINPSPTRTPAAKVATPNAPNREIPPKRKVQTSSRGVGKTTREKPRPRPDPISLRFGQVIPLLARIGIFCGRPEGLLSTAEGPRPFQPRDPRPLHRGRGRRADRNGRAARVVCAGGQSGAGLGAPGAWRLMGVTTCGRSGPSTSLAPRSAGRSAPTPQSPSSHQSGGRSSGGVGRSTAAPSGASCC